MNCSFFSNYSWKKIHKKGHSKHLTINLGTFSQLHFLVQLFKLWFIFILGEIPDQKKTALRPLTGGDLNLSPNKLVCGVNYLVRSWTYTTIRSTLQVRPVWKQTKPRRKLSYWFRTEQANYRCENAPSLLKHGPISVELSVQFYTKQREVCLKWYV